MAITLEAIKFNHDSSSASNDALNLRRNATDFVPVPEWQRGVSVNPEDSPAAYSIQDTQGQTLTIKARFHRDSVTKAVQVRALDDAVSPPGPGGCLGWLVDLVRALLRALFGNVLGEVPPTKVVFDAQGNSGYVTLPLVNARLWTAGVGVRTTTWRWQYRLGSGPWTDMVTTSHRIYSVLRVPTAPWQQAPYNAANTQLPWTEVLDHACGWAALSSTLEQAAARVTEKVNALGPATVTYDCPGGGSSHYSWGGFDCTAFLERLRGGTGNGVYVNCSDCATIVSTFANALGCDLWQSRMGYGFGLNPMLGIGSSVWQPACGWSGFSYHEVAWESACGANEPVWDACLKVDADADPTTPPHTALLPTNMRFGNSGDGDYRDHLATPAGRPNCNPQPGTRTRRSVA
jgi:hypothetical protein